MKVRRISLSRQILLMFTILLAVGDLLIGLVVYRRTQGLFMEKVQENAMNLAQCAAANVDAEIFLQVLSEGNGEGYEQELSAGEGAGEGYEQEPSEENGEGYEQILEELCNFRDNSSLKYIYTFAKNEQGDVIFVVDADEEDPAEFGELYGEQPEGMVQAFSGENAVDQEPSSDEWGVYVSAYSPIKDGSKVIGIVGADVDYGEVQKSIRRIVGIIAGICVTVFAVLFVVLLWISRRMNKGFGTLNDKIVELADGSGDLRKKIQISSGDEFEVIGESINGFLDQLQKLVSQVASSSNGNAQEIRSINNNTLSLSANMEECSASTEDVSMQLGQAVLNVEELASQVQAVSDQAAEASERARKAAELAVAHKFESEQHIEEIQKDIAQVAKQAESVQQVQKINDQILSIVKQTRILSLNAQVEAARAGESGKGFVVVAKQVAKLSDDISMSVVDIGNINEQVIDAMNQMVSYLENMNDFLKGAVLQDYISFAEIGKDYGETTEIMQQRMQELKDRSAEIAMTISGVSNSISDISTAVSESADQIEQLCGSTVEMSEGIEELLEIPILKLQSVS